ncbi:MAG TPA: hypothetical protein VFF17_03905 [Thermoanaerobaculia bacterium]|nr:hypothetical protein [Thermoanaerobaculia bacterium]
MHSRPRFGYNRVESALASLLLVLVSGCATAPRLSPSVAAERIRSDVSTGMTKAEVRRVVGEPERRESTSLPWGDVGFRRVSGSDRPGECWLWGVDRLKPDAYVCFGGLDPTVSHKGP